MRVLRSECAGACYGVQRALDMAIEEVGRGGSVQTLGPLIHNPQVVAHLGELGVGVADDPDQIRAQTVIIRSHGVTPDVMGQVQASGARIVNATCPHVLRAQKAAEKLARDHGLVVVVGERSHPEVEGLVAHAREAGGDVVVVDSPEDLPEGINGDVGVVVQTTQPRAKLEEVVAALEARGANPQVKDTICDATSDRQSAAERLAAQVDAMVVIGGHNSSNTTRLFEICSRVAPAAYHVEIPEELQKEHFAGCVTVGVTAGASTPESQIRQIEELLESW